MRALIARLLHRPPRAAPTTLAAFDARLRQAEAQLADLAARQARMTALVSVRLHLGPEEASDADGHDQPA